MKNIKSNFFPKISMVLKKFFSDFRFFKKELRKSEKSFKYPKFNKTMKN